MNAGKGVTHGVTIVEVGPRDGFQSVGPFIPTARKIELITALYAAGVRRMEATSFVSEKAVPQMADAVEVLAAAQLLPGLETQVLVPSVRQAERALKAGARHLAFVVSVSEAHNRNNVRRSPEESLVDYAQIVALLPAGMKLRLSLSTAFDCPFEGRVPEQATLAMLERLAAIAPGAEIALADTTGRATPGQVQSLFGAATGRFPQVKRWALHVHDTYGMGAANCLAAWNAGISVFDASVAGLGGCPFAPGATGNVATEDLVWMFEGMGINTGVDLAALLAVAGDVARLPGAQTGGRVRDAVHARACRLSGKGY